MRVEIPMKLPSLNQYINECRRNRYAAAQMKFEVENEISYYIFNIPNFKRPIKIHFTWIEENKKRDLDNVCFAKKFILDAMVKCGKLKNDNRKYVIGFTDSFEYGDKAKVILDIEEVENDY